MTWQQSYWAALLEDDVAKRLDRIQEAQEVMQARTEYLPAISPQELQEMRDATYAMQILRRELQVGGTPPHSGQ